MQRLVEHHRMHHVAFRARDRLGDRIADSAGW
jgi:hypothetical protein